MKKIAYYFVCRVLTAFLFVKLYHWGKDYAKFRLERPDKPELKWGE